MRTIERLTRANEISSRLAGPRFDGDEAPLVVIHPLAQRAILEKRRASVGNGMLPGILRPRLSDSERTATLRIRDSKTPKWLSRPVRRWMTRSLTKRLSLFVGLRRFVGGFEVPGDRPESGPPAFARMTLGARRYGGSRRGGVGGEPPPDPSGPSGAV